MPSTKKESLDFNFADILDFLQFDIQTLVQNFI